jgi:hypothetical protein
METLNGLNGLVKVINHQASTTGVLMYENGRWLACKNALFGIIIHSGWPPAPRTIKISLPDWYLRFGIFLVLGLW